MRPTADNPVAEPGGAAPPLVLPYVIAHRGASASAPENTLAALRRAAALGARWVEIDVQLSADGVPVVIHDPTLRRTTDGQGRVAGKTARELAALDAGSWFAPEFAGETVPTLAAVVACCAELGIGLNAELKPVRGRETAMAEAAAPVLAGAGPDVLVSSFSPLALSAFHRAGPALPLGYLSRSVPTRVTLARLPALYSVHVALAGLSQAKVARLRAAGYRVLVYTVNYVDRAVELRAWGVDAIFTDHPDLVLMAMADARG